MNRLPGPLWRLLAILAAALLPSALPGDWPARPDLVLLVVVAAGLMQGPLTGGLVGLAAGWVVDLVPPGTEPLGATALVYLVAGVVAGGMRRYASWSPLTPLIATAAAVSLVQGVRVVAAAAGAGATTVGQALWGIGLTLVAALVLLPVLVLVERALLGRGWA